MALRSFDGTDLELKFWQKLLLAPLLLFLIIGVFTISMFFAGGLSALGFGVGIALLAIGSVGLLEIGRAGGAPIVSPRQIVVPGAVLLALAIGYVAIMGVVPGEVILILVGSVSTARSGRRRDPSALTTHERQPISSVGEVLSRLQESGVDG